MQHLGRKHKSLTYPLHIVDNVHGFSWYLLIVCFMSIVYSINKHKLPNKTNKVNESYLKELIILLVLKLYIRQR